MEHLQNIQQIFADKILRVPDYQRGYAWDKRQWNDLLDDLDLLSEKHEHYTGTLVLHSTGEREILNETGESLYPFDIVDGQQRLTTIILLLDAIAREMRSLPERTTMAEGLYRRYIKFKDSSGFEHTKLRLNRDTNDYFQSLLSRQAPLEGPKNHSQKRLEEAQGFFRDYLLQQRKRLPEQQEYAAWLEGLMRKITVNIKLTVYEVSMDAEVGVIFEVMNNRGKPLSEMEKVKNYLLYLASKVDIVDAAMDLAKDINRVWTTIFETLMAAGAIGNGPEDQLLRSHWLMAYDPQPKNWNGNNSVKAKFNLKAYQGRGEDLIRDIRNYIDSLNDACIAYCDLLSPNRNEAYAQILPENVRMAVKSATERLKRIDAMASFLPLLYAVRLRYRDDPELYLRFLQAAEKYAFRVYRFAEKRANAGQSVLFHRAHELYHGKIDPESCLAALVNLLLYYAPENEFLAKFEPGRLNWYQWYGLKYFLYEYEEYLADGHPVRIPWSDLVKKDKRDTIEHILPQTPDKPYWLERWSKEEIETYMHDIGNLVLTYDNSSYSNKPFPDKKGTPDQEGCYAHSVLFMEKDLCRYHDWTQKELQHRREQIVTWAKNRWRVEQTGTIAIDLIADEEEPEVAASSED